MYSLRGGASGGRKLLPGVRPKPGEAAEGLPSPQAVETALDDFCNVGHHHRRRRRLHVAAAGAWPAFCKSL